MATNKELLIQTVKLQQRLDALRFELTMLKSKLTAVNDVKTRLLQDLAKGVPTDELLCTVAEGIGNATKHKNFGDIVRYNLEMRCKAELEADK